jgi:hypothetical protein
MEGNILTSGNTTRMASGKATMGGGMGITDGDEIITDDMKGIITGVTFVMTTVATIIRRRLDRISKTFAMREMKSAKGARSCAGITES